jgi:hypothetical protein
MRFLMKIVMPDAAQNPLVGETQFQDRLQGVLRQIGALANYSRDEDGRRVDYVLVDLTPEQITAAAEPVFRLLKVKPEFLPEIVPRPYYGRSGY